MKKQVTVADLKPLVGTPYPRPLLHCKHCQEDCSADKSDYFYLPSDHVFECCGVPMTLAVRKVTYSTL